MKMPLPSGFSSSLMGGLWLKLPGDSSGFVGGACGCLPWLGQSLTTKRLEE
jgi:hypothetical protein